MIPRCLDGPDFLDDEALEAAREDRNEGNHNESDEVLLRPLEDGVQPPVAAQPGKGALDDPADAGGNELSVPAAGNRLDGDAECLSGLAQPLAAVAEITQRRPLKAAIGKRAQHRRAAQARSTGTMALVSC